MAKNKMDKKTAPKLPKRIGGVKLTKELRKAGGRLLERANSPVGRELIAAGLSMAATAAGAAAKRERERSKHGGDKGAPTAPGATTSGANGAAGVPPRGAGETPPRGGGTSGTGTDPHAMGVILGKMAQDALGQLFARKPVK